jgi:nicotinamide mononucleotide (NMN) deamidase PncC
MQPDNKDIIKELHKFFKSNDLTLSVVESCTGGLISSMITDLPGASDYFDSGIVTEGTRRLRKTDHSLSVTGNLGPSALEGKDVGLVYFAATSSGGTYSKGMRFSGTRKQIKRQAALYALQFLHDVTDL